MDSRHGRPARVPDPMFFASHQLRRRLRSHRRLPQALRAAQGGCAMGRLPYDGASPPQSSC